MKITALALPLAVALASCGSENSYLNFAGTYTGTLTETYTCASNSPPAFPLNETLTITQLGTDISVGISSCIGQTIAGDASGNSVSLTPGSQTNSPCQQQTPTDAGSVPINVSSLAGGSIMIGSGGNLTVTLNQNATIDNNSNACSGTATGTLTLQ